MCAVCIRFVLYLYMRASVCVYVCVYVGVRVCVCTRTYVSYFVQQARGLSHLRQYRACVCVFIHVCMCACVLACVSVCLCNVCVRARQGVHVCLCALVFKFLCIFDQPLNSLS